MMNPMMSFPGIYELKQIHGEYTLNYVSFKFKEPEKLYGKLPKYINFYWNAFVRRKFNSGVILTGQAGAGKSEMAKILSNLCVEKNAMKVILLSNIQFNQKLITYLDLMDNVVFFFDEFGKSFNTSQQDKMLTMLSNTLGMNRIVIITENHKNRISPFILNRPGRITYALHFGKLDVETITEYCEEFKVLSDFYDDLLDAYRGLVTFTIDHLKAIVEEHISNRDMKLKELLELLNLDFISGNDILKLYKLEEIGDEDEVKIEFDFTKLRIYPNEILMSHLELPRFTINLDGFVIDPTIEMKEEDNEAKPSTPFGNSQIRKNERRIDIGLNNKNILDLNSEFVVFKKDNYKITFKILKG